MASSITSKEEILRAYKATGYLPITNGWGGRIGVKTYADPTQVLIAHRQISNGLPAKPILGFEDIALFLGWTYGYLDQFIASWDGQDEYVPESSVSTLSLLEHADAVAGETLFALRSTPVENWPCLARNSEDKGVSVECVIRREQIDGCECQDFREILSRFTE